MLVLGGLVGLAVLAVLAVWLYIVRQGDAEFAFVVAQRTPFSLIEKTETTAVFSCKVPFFNQGTQDGTVMDAYTRHLLPKEQYDGVDVVARLELESDPRSDSYWEAIIIPKGTGRIAVVTLKLTARQGDIDSALAQLPDFGVDIVYQIVARSPWYIAKSPRLEVLAEELRQACGALDRP